jgi:hypothetical protein
MFNKANSVERKPVEGFTQNENNNLEVQTIIFS